MPLRTPRLLLTAAEAREIGDCAIRAIATVTGRSWNDVFVHAQADFTRHGLNAGGVSRALRALGWTMSPAYDLFDRTVADAEAYLQTLDPDVRLIATIRVRRTPHAIAFTDRRFHNTQGVRRGRIGLADRCLPCPPSS